MCSLTPWVFHERDASRTSVKQGAANFATFGRQNEVAQEHHLAAEGTYDWVISNCARERLDPNGMGAGIWREADAGNIPQEEATLLVRAMLSAGLDSTIIAIGNTLSLLSQHPRTVREGAREPEAYEACN